MPEMTSTREEISPSSRIGEFAGEGTHSAYFFRDSREKQLRLFRLCVDCLEGSTLVLYIAGKQGTKGIRLSMKDSGVDVAAFERKKKLKIADSEEWFLNSGRTATFKATELLTEQLKRMLKEWGTSGKEELMVICETDQLVRKGFIKYYMEFERTATELADGTSIAFVCAYDERELSAAHVAREEIAKLHSKTIG